MKSDLLAFAPSLDTFLRGEPERSRRVLRLLAANDLAWCDRPAVERPAFAVPRLRIYQADPSAPPAARALPPEELARWADSILINPRPLADGRLGEVGPERSLVAGPAQGGGRGGAFHPGDGPPARLAGRGPEALFPHPGRHARSR